MKGKILFIDTVHPYLQFQLEQNGWSCIDGSQWNKATTVLEIGNFEGIVIRSRFKSYYLLQGLVQEWKILTSNLLNHEELNA